MNKQQTLQLILNENTRNFHQVFEKNLKLSSFARESFGDDALLFQIRKVYLYEDLAQSSISKADKFEYYQNGLNIIDSLFATSISKPEHLLFVCHYAAKLNYQLGTLWMQMDSSLDENGLDKAKQCFETALCNYDLFKTTAGIDSDHAFCEASYQLHLSFNYFDAYSPWARVISCAYNHYRCCEENISDDISLDALLVDLEAKIALSRDVAGSPSYAAVEEVRHNVQQIKSSQLSSHSSFDFVAETTANVVHVEPAKKRKKISSSSYQPASERTWSRTVLSLSQFQESVQKDTWSIPSFLRQRQIQDMQAIYGGFKQYTKPLLVTKPTGTGKTAEFTALTNSAYCHGVCTIIVVPTITLVMQTREKFIEYKAHNADMNYALPDILAYSPTTNLREIGPITIVTMASFINQTKKALKKFPTKEALQQHIEHYPDACFKNEVFFHPAFFSLLIIDEGHHIDGDQFYNIVTRADCERPKILFSASTLLGNYPRIDRIVHAVVTQTLKEAILARELSPLQMLTLDFSMYPEAKELTRSIRRRIKENIDVNIEEEVGQLLYDNIGFSYTAAGIIKQLYEKVPTTRKLMVFTDSIDHADLLAKILTQVFNKQVDSFHTQKKNREQILARFKSVPQSIVVAVGALDEGFDESDVNLILDFSLYRQRTRRLIQRIGRAERIREDGSSAIILNIKVLANDLQLLPRDVIMGEEQLHSYLGLPEDEVVSEQLIDLVLPPPIFIQHDVGGVHISKEIRAQGAKIMFPKNKTRHKIGMPPVDDEPVYAGRFFSASSSSHHGPNVNHSSVAAVTEDDSVDLIFSLEG